MLDMFFGPRRRRKALQEGQPALAQVVDVRSTHLRRDSDPNYELAIKLHVSVNGAQPYAAETRASQAEAAAAGVQVGALVRCWVHPENPSYVAIEVPGRQVVVEERTTWAERIFDFVLFWL